MHAVRRALLLLLGYALALACCAGPQPGVEAPAVSVPAPPPVPNTTVVLLPDADGTTGQATVANRGGTRTLDQANTATRVLDARTAPAEPTPLTAGEIAAVFGAALEAQPQPPRHYVLYFEHGSTELTAASRQELPAVLAAIRERASVDTSVVGHSDTAGEAQSNLDLSLRRATAVGALLVAAGVDPGVLDITSHGEADPLVPTGDNVSEPRNRRVEVVVR